MTRLEKRHVTSLVHAKKLFENARRKDMDPKYAKALERDIKSLSDIHSVIYELIANPALPCFDPKPVTDGPVLAHISTEANSAF